MAAKSGVGFSKKTDSKEAGVEAAKLAIEGLGGSDCTLVLVFSTSKHSAAQIKDGVRSIVGPKARIIGGYSVGIITKEHLSYGGYEVGVAALSVKPEQIDMIVQHGLDKGEFNAGAALANQFKAKNYPDLGGMLLMYDSIRDTTPSLNMATPMLAGMNESLGGKWPSTAGVGMLGDMQWQKTWQIFDDTVSQQSAMILALKSGLKMDSIILHGCKPSGGYHKVTKTDGPVILEIEGRPAIDVVSELLGGSKSWEEYPLFVTLGVNKGNKFEAFKEENYANRLCMGVDKERGGLVMFEPDILPGMEVQLMRRSVDFNYMKQRVDELFEKLEGKKPFFAFYIDCAGRASAYCNAESEEAVEIQKHVGSRIPFLGVYSGVEIAKVGSEIQALDWTGVLCVVSE